MKVDEKTLEGWLDAIESRRAIEELELYHDGHPFVPGVAINTLLLGLPHAEAHVSCVYNEKPASYKYMDFFRAFATYLHFLCKRMLGELRVPSFCH